MEKVWQENELNEVEDVPGGQAVVTFGDVKLEEVGQVLTPTVVQNPPNIGWNAESTSFYTIFMTDPDAPSRKNPKFREWFHWGVINVPGSNINEGEVFAPYIGAGPPKGTGLHRYVILVYKQSAKVTYEQPKFKLSTDGRATQKVRDIAKKLNVGSPIAGACFQAEWDNYVPILYEKLGS